MTAFYVFDGIKIKKQKKNQYIVRCRSNIEHPNGAKQCYRQTCFFSSVAFLCCKWYVRWYWTHSCYDNDCLNDVNAWTVNEWEAHFLFKGNEFSPPLSLSLGFLFISRSSPLDEIPLQQTVCLLGLNDLANVYTILFNYNVKLKICIFLHKYQHHQLFHVYLFMPVMLWLFGRKYLILRSLS